MTLTLVLVATGLFFVALERSRLIRLSHRVIAESSGALRLIASPDLDDDAKEIEIRRLAIEMLRLFAQMLVRVFAVLLAPTALVYAAVLAGATDLDSVWRIIVSWPLLLTNVLIFAFVVFRRRSA